MVAFGLRAFDLASDPAGYWPFFTAWGDEGNWNYPPAYAASTGTWPPQFDEPSRLVPLYVQLQRVVLGVLGPGLVQARLVSAVAGLCTTGLLGWLFLSLGPRWALFAAAIYGTNFWAVAVDRFASPEALCGCLLTGALLIAVRPERLGGGALLGALVLSGAALLAKPPAAFGVVTLLLYLLWQGLSPALRSRTRWAITLASLACLTILVVLALLVASAYEGSSGLGRSIAGAARLYHLPTALERVGPFLVATASTWFRGLQFYPFVAHLTLPLAGVGLLLATAGTLGAERDGLQARVRAYALIWIAAWWALAPLTGFRGLRYALLLPAVTILGVLGFSRFLSWLSLGGTWSRSGTTAAVAYTLWFLGMWSAQLADVTHSRALVWLSALLPAAGLVALAVGLAIRHARGPCSPWVQCVAMVAILLQCMVFGAWIRERTHLVVEAQRRTSAASLGGGLVCGRQAAVLLLPTPTHGRALDIHYYPDCQLEGRVADFIVFARSPACLATDPRPFIVGLHRHLLFLPELARVELEGWNESRRLSCEYSLVRLPKSGLTPAGSLPRGGS